MWGCAPCHTPFVMVRIFDAGGTAMRMRCGRTGEARGLVTGRKYEHISKFPHIQILISVSREYRARIPNARLVFWLAFVTFQGLFRAFSHFNQLSYLAKKIIS